MGFTAAEKARDPDADVVGGGVEGVRVVLKEGDKMLFQLPCDHILADFPLSSLIDLVHLDDAVDFAVDIVREHCSDIHCPSP